MANSNQNIETPVEFVRAVESFLRIEFEYDMAASYENKKAPQFVPEAMDSLAMTWPTDGWCWLNPPFRNLTKWVRKCREQCLRGAKIVSIWPLSGDHNQLPAWSNATVYVLHGRVWPEVRSCMLCVWDCAAPLPRTVAGLTWDKSRLYRAWGL